MAGIMDFLVVPLNSQEIVIFNIFFDGEMNKIFTLNILTLQLNSYETNIDGYFINAVV